MVVMDFHRVVVVVVVREALERMLSQPIVLETGVPASSQAYLAKPMVKVGGLRVVEVVGWIIAHRPSLVQGSGGLGVGVTAEEERVNLVYLIPVVGVGVQIIQVQMYMVATVAPVSSSFDTLWMVQLLELKQMYSIMCLAQNTQVPLQHCTPMIQLGIGLPYIMYQIQREMEVVIFNIQ